jgi:hypothetical protein
MERDQAATGTGDNLAAQQAVLSTDRQDMARASEHKRTPSDTKMVIRLNAGSAMLKWSER